MPSDAASGQGYRRNPRKYQKAKPRKVRRSKVIGRRGQGFVRTGPKARPVYEPVYRKKKGGGVVRTKVGRKHVPAPGRPPARPVRAAPYALLDRVDRKKGKTVPVRAKSVKALNRRTKAYRLLRELDKRGEVGRKLVDLKLGPRKDKDTKILGFNIEAELEGRGVLSKGSRALGEALAQEYGTEQNIRESSLLPKSLKKIGQAGTREVAQLPAAIPSALYGIGAGGLEASKGRPQRSKEQWRQLKKHDPFFLAAQGKWKRAKEAAKEAPVGTALTVSGVGKAASLAGGKVARVDTRREPRRAPGTRMETPRRYPKGLVGNKAARANEKRKVRRAEKSYAQAREARRRGERDEAAQLQARAVESDPRVMSEPEIRSRQDYREGLAEARRRVHRSKAVGAADRALAKDGADAQLLIAQGIIKPSRRSVQRYLRDLEREARKGLSPARRVSNTRLRRQLRKLGSDKTDFKALEAKAGEYAKVVNPLQAKLVKERILPVGQAKKAKLIPYAVRDMGAKFDPVPRESSKGKRFREAQKVERDAARDLRKATRQAHTRRVHAARKEGQVSVNVARADRARLAKDERYVEVRTRLREAEKNLKVTGARVTNEAYVGLSRGNPLEAKRRYDQARKKVSEVRKEVKKVVATIEREAQSKVNRRPGRQLLTLEKYKAAEALAEHRAAGARKRFDEARAARIDAKVKKAERIEKDVLRAPDGRILTTKEIKRHVKASGRDPSAIAYVTQAPGQRGGKNFFMNWNEPKGLSTKTRTGEATRKGTFDVDREVGRENVARMQSLLDAANEYKEFVKETGHRPTGKKVKVYKGHAAAMEAKREFEAAGHPYPLKPVPLTPQFGRKEQADSILDQVNADASTMEGVTGAVEKALKGEGDESGRWVLVPEASADQAAKHTRTLDPTVSGKAARLALQQFRGSVLTTSPTWPTGNIIEGLSRRAVARAGPVSAKLAADAIRKLDEIDPLAAEQLKVWIGKGHIGSQELRHIHTTAEHFKGTKWAKVARAMGTARRTKGPKGVADAWGAYTRFIFEKNGMVEAQLKQAMLGRYIKDQLLPPRAIRDWDKAVEQAARGLLNTNEQVAAVRWLDRAYGKYNNWGPDAKRIIGTYTPFAAWSINAFRFIYSVLPRDHPILTAGLVEAEKATREWREAEGMEVVSNFLKAAVPVGGSLRNIGRYTPFGVMADPVESVGGLLLPNISGAWMATKGLDWKGDPIRETSDPKFGSKRADDVSTGARISEGGKSLLAAMVPLFGQVKRGSEKEGNVGEKALQTLNPFRAFEKGNPKLQRAFDERDRIRAELDRLPPLTELAEGSPRWRKRRQLLDRQKALGVRINRQSGGRYGTKKVRRKSSGGGNPFATPRSKSAGSNPFE